jgi:hypothetical protein
VDAGAALAAWEGAGVPSPDALQPQALTTTLETRILRKNERFMLGSLAVCFES